MKIQTQAYFQYLWYVVSAFLISVSTWAQTIPVSLNWTSSTDGILFSSPTIDSSGKIYVGSNDNKLHAFSSTDGSAIWTFTTGSWVDTTPALSHDESVVYFGSWDNKLYAVNVETGTEIWSFETNSYIQSSPAVGLDGKIYFGSMDSIFYALEDDGSLAWEYFAGQTIFSSPAIGSDGTLYFGDENGTLHAVHSDGSVKWTYLVDEVTDTNRSILSSPVLDTIGNIYFGSGNGFCYSLSDDGDSASLNWKYETGDRVDSSPVLGINDEVFFVSRDGYMRSLPLFSATTENLPNWEVFVGDVFYSTPVVDENGRVYVIGYTGGGENHLFAYDTDGTKAWDSNVSSPPFEIPSVVDSSLLLSDAGDLYFGCFDQNLYSLSLGLAPANSGWPMFRRNSTRNGDWPSHNLSVQLTPSASGSVSGGGPFYEGTQAPISASPNLGYSFAGWAGEGVSEPNASTTTVTMTEPRTVSASFSLNSYELTLLPGLGGEVSGEGSFNHGSTPTISASPTSGYSFAGWAGEGVSDTNASTTTVTMTEPRTVSASFSLNSYELTLLAGSGGSVSGGGQYSHGTLATISANPSSGYSFVGWTGSGISDRTSPTTSVLVSENQTVTAEFVEIVSTNYLLTLQASPSDGGILTGGGLYPEDQNVSITATPQPGYAFEQWTGGSIPSPLEANTSFLIDNNLSLTALFNPLTYSILVQNKGGGSVTGEGNYSFGSEANLSALPATGYQFEYWDGGGVDEPLNPNITVLVTNDLSLAAIFSPQSYQLHTNTSTGGSVYFSGNNPFLYDSNVSLSAAPDPGYIFSGWTGAGVQHPDQSNTLVRMTEDRNISALFETVELSLIVLQNLTVAGQVSGAGFYQSNQFIQLSASPNPGYRFSHWLGSGIEEPLQPNTRIFLTSDSLAVASFSLSQLSQALDVTHLGNNWFSSWLGTVYQTESEWIYHLPLGWLYPQTMESSLWLWSEEHQWIWVEKESFSENFIWLGSIEEWVYLDLSSSTAPRYYNYQSESWASW